MTTPRLASALVALLSAFTVAGGLTEGLKSSVGETPVWNHNSSFYGDTQVVEALFDDHHTNNTIGRLSNSSHPLAEFGAFPQLGRRQNDKVPLRILTLGASTARGVGSSHDLGFRKDIRDAFRYEGHDVNMVGSQNFGDGMRDNDHEAEPGAILSGIRSNLQRSLGPRANVVIIQAGTNNARGSTGVTTAGTAMKEMMWDIWNAPGMSDTCIFVVTLLWTDHHPGETNRLAMNDQYRAAVADLQGSKCAYIADADPPRNTPGYNWIGRDLINDGIHPNDEGFRRMSWVIYSRMKQALQDGRIKAPTGPIDLGFGKGCDKQYGNGIGAGGYTQRGSGLDDGKYRHSSDGKGVLLEMHSDFDRDQWRFARLFSKQRDDLVEWFEPTPGVHAFGVWKNLGNGNFDKIDDMYPGLFCNPRGLHFIDMNGDGLDDIVCIDGDGNAYMKANEGNGGGRKPPSFRKVVGNDRIKTHEGFKQDRVRLADIDGDGRGDYCIINDGGHVHCWRNGWVHDMPEYWQALGQVFAAKGMGDVRGVRFEDLNGDGRDDWLWVGDEGRVHTWTNTRACGSGMLANWQEHDLGHNTPTHRGMGDIQSSGVRARIHFARIFGEPQEFGLDGRQDYVFIQHEKLSNGRHKFYMHVWKSKGWGSTKVKLDGNKYCNMVGHENGREDYVWVLSKGEMTIYPNAGRKSVSDNGPSFWGPSEVIWRPPGANMDRRDLHLADWDGDGVCDIIYTDPNNDNRVQVWINKHKQTGRWTWEHKPNPAGHVHCTQKRGLGFTDLAVRFADLTGNGQADYLCIEKDGKVTGFVHNSGDSFGPREQIKFPETMDRANLRWADVNGDGRDDMLWIDKFSGDASVWYNGDRGNPADLGGSSFFWRKISRPVYDGNQAGACMFHPDLDGNGRADMHSVEGSWTNKARTWFNPDCGFTDETGDDGRVRFPSLPVQPGDPGWGQPGSGDPNDPQPITAPWLEVSCDYGTLPSDRHASEQRWDDAKATEAWEAALEDWKDYQEQFPNGGDMMFTEVVVDFFNGPSKKVCTDIPDPNCPVTVPCDQSMGPGGAHGVNSPAGYMIVNSFAHLYSPMVKMDSALSAAQARLQGESSDIVAAFTSISKNTEAKISMEVANMIVGLALAPMWNSWIKKVPIYPQYENFLGAAKDSAQVMVAGSINVAKDIMTTVADASVNLQSIATATCTALRYANRNMAKKLFDGKDTKLIDQMMRRGIAHATKGIDPFEVEVGVYKALVAASTPVMWTTERPSTWIFVMTDEDIPRKSGSKGCDGLEPHRKTLQHNRFTNAFACVDGRGYWIMMIGNVCNRGPHSLCEYNYNPDAPYGIQHIDGKNFGGLTREDLVRSALAGKKANGGKNGWGPADVNKQSTLESFVNEGVRAPGVFNAPVCSLDEAMGNFRAGTGQPAAGTWPGFPCNKP